MSSDQNKNTLNDVVARLIKLTQENKLRWGTVVTPLPEDPNRVSAVLEAIHNGKRLRIYKTRHETKTNNTGMVGLGALINLGKYHYIVHLEIVDVTGDIIFEFPNGTPLFDLLTAAQYQVAGVADFFKDLLNDETT